VRIGEYLSRVILDPNSRPPDAAGVYLVSRHRWREPSDSSAELLYVAQARYLRHRIGQLLIELLGFTSDDPVVGEAYEHRGGHFLWHRYCLERRIEPVALNVAWHSQCLCLDCAEARLSELVTVESKPPPSKCGHHDPMLDLSDACPVRSVESDALR